MCCVTFFDLHFNGNHVLVSLFSYFFHPAAVFTYFNFALLARIRNALRKSPTGKKKSSFSVAFVDILKNIKLEFKLQISL
jgi:hypothetical protein